MTEATTPDTLALALRIAQLIRERRGTDLVLLDVRALVDYTDYFLLASGQSGRQNQAIGEHVVRSLKADHRYAISKSGLDTGSWICLDMGDVVVHGAGGVASSRALLAVGATALAGSEGGRCRGGDGDLRRHPGV